ncbi:MAG: ATP-binding cassette domain-containing protein [Planctomycetota bacterium]
MDAISVTGLTKTYRVAQKGDGVAAALRSVFRPTYRKVFAVRDVSFRVEPGEMVAFLGPNGAGKTTTLKLLAGLIEPTGGEARVLGHVPWRREHAFRRRFALVMGQKNQLWWDLPARASFGLQREIYGVPSHDFDPRLDELTSLLAVTDLLDQPVRELSLGERMKMELIAALLHAPDLLLLDEPTIGLDVVSQRTVQSFLKKYQAERGITVLLTSHYMKDVEALCRRAVVIDRGRVMHDGPISDIVDRFATHKIVDIEFAADVPTGLGRYGSVQAVTPPRAKLEVARGDVPRVLADVLSREAVTDVSVHEPPLEEVIAAMFTEQAADKTPEPAAAAVTP